MKKITDKCTNHLLFFCHAGHVCVCVCDVTWYDCSVRRRVSVISTAQLMPFHFHLYTKLHTVFTPFRTMKFWLVLPALTSDPLNTSALCGAYSGAQPCSHSFTLCLFIFRRQAAPNRQNAAIPKIQKKKKRKHRQTKHAKEPSSKQNNTIETRNDFAGRWNDNSKTRIKN